LAGGLPTAFFLHFVASLTLCGLIAAVYPYFAVTLFAVGGLLPVLLRAGPEPPGPADLVGPAKRMSLYLFLAAAVPMLAVLALVMIGSENRFPPPGPVSAGGAGL